MSVSPVRIGVIGGGMMSQVGHLPFYLSDPRCAVIAVAESRPSLAAALVERLGRERVVGDHRKLLEDRGIEAVVISMPRPTTGPLTLEALEAGKHVLAEKPMAHTAAQARRLVEAAQARRLIYAVGCMKRYDPGVEAAKAAFERLVAEGRLGRLLFVRLFNFAKSYAVSPPPHVRPAESRARRLAAWPLWPEWLPAPLQALYLWFVNAVCHDINLLHLFFPDGIEVDTAARNGDDALVAAMRHDGVPIMLEAARTEAGRWIEGGEFLFERGRLGFALPSPMDPQGVATVRLDDEPAGRVDQPLETGAGWSFARQAEAFIDAVRGGAPPRTPGEQGLSDMLLIEAIFRRLGS